MKTLYGFYKLQEEMGELNQVMGKLGPFPTGRHPGTKKDLYKHLEEELADVTAAIEYFCSVNDLTLSHDRVVKKLKKFRKWGLTGIDGEES